VTNKDRILQLITVLMAAAAALAITACSSEGVNTAAGQRSAALPACQHLDSSCMARDEAVAELMAATQEGSNEPTAVAAINGLALIGVNRSPSFAAPSGELLVVSIAGQSIVTRIPLIGWPESIDVTPNGGYAVVVIETESDGYSGYSAASGMPSRTVDIIDISGPPERWMGSPVDLGSVVANVSEQPEPDEVAITDDNIAVISLQESNQIVMVDVESASIVDQFDGGAGRFARRLQSDDSSMQLRTVALASRYR